MKPTIGDEMDDRTVNSLGNFRKRWSDPVISTLTVMLILMLFVFAPLGAVGISAFRALGLASELLIIGGIFFLSASPVALVAALGAFAMSGWVAFARLTAPSAIDVYLAAGSWLIMSLVLGVVVGRAVFAAGRVNYHRIIGAILVYLCIAVGFMALFTIVGLLVPNAFSGMQFEDSPSLASQVIYFSFVTLTSTGYGDIYPLHPVARSLCNFETILGQLYPATLLARLVSLEIESRR